MAEQNGDDKVKDDNSHALNAAPIAPEVTPLADPRNESSSTSGANVEEGTQLGEQEETEKDEDEEEEDEESEPHLKYTKLSGHLSAVFKNKDSASTCLTSSDKLIVGTHNGSVYIFSIPSLDILRTYKAHSASVTAISVSPYSPTLSLHNHPNKARNAPLNHSSVSSGAPTSSSGKLAADSSPGSKRTHPAASVQQQNNISDSLHIATSSLDGHVCVSSLVDQKQVTLRNFARPIQAVALSPDFKSSRVYLSGGLAGQLILTTGGRIGESENASTVNAAAAASGWLSQIGLSNSTGRDTILHQGEGGIKAIRWSLTDRFVAWVNDTGIKVMRSNLALGSEDSELAWRRVGHFDRPDRQVWEENSASWKASIQWVDNRYLEKDDDKRTDMNGSQKFGAKTEKLLVGWGDTVWVINVYSEGSAARTGTSKAFKKPDILHRFNFDDGVVSGLSLYTPTLLLALIYRTKDDDDNPISTRGDSAPRRGIKRRQNGMPPELRLLNVTSRFPEELEIESLRFDKYQSLSFADYHMSTTYFAPKRHPSQEQKSSLGVIGDGLLDVSKNATRLFGSNASIVSGSSSDRGSERQSISTSQSIASPRGLLYGSKGLPSGYAKPGLKIFIISPFDSLLAVKRDASDHLEWLKEQEQYEEAWTYVDSHPDVVVPSNQSPVSASRPDTPSKAQETLAEFLEDDSSSTSSAMTIKAKNKSPAVVREKRRIGDLWIQQLVKAGSWPVAGEITQRVLDTAERWQYWISVFIDAEKFDDITPHTPSTKLKPPIRRTLYEHILQHYLEKDPPQLQTLLHTWDTDLYDVLSITSTIESKLRSDEPDGQHEGPGHGMTSPNWLVLQNSLSHLYIAADRPAEALQCCLLTRNADTAIQLVKENQLFVSIADRVYTFATIRVSHQQATSAPLEELDDISKDSIELLASAASQNIISVSSAIHQFQEHSPTADPYLFFYLRNLWKGENDSTQSDSEPATQSRTRNLRFASNVSNNPTRHLLASHGDLAVTLFATYAPPLLNELLRARDASSDPSTGGSIPYSFEHASAICEYHGLTAELVYLLAATGQTREALRRICEGTTSGLSQEQSSKEDIPNANVEWAITFCHEMDDQGLWDDLLAFAITRPVVLRGLLGEVGIGSGARGDSNGELQTGIEPVKLIQRIPDGLEIPGLKEALERLLRDADVQRSIAAGAAQVLKSEISIMMKTLDAGRRRGVAFESGKDSSSMGTDLETTAEDSLTVKSTAKSQISEKWGTLERSNRCTICHEPCNAQSGRDEAQKDYVTAYVCGHMYHLRCILDAYSTPNNKKLINEIEKLNDAVTDNQQQDTGGGWRRGRVGAKIGMMQMIGRIIGGKSCPRCERDRKTLNSE